MVFSFSQALLVNLCGIVSISMFYPAYLSSELVLKCDSQVCESVAHLTPFFKNRV